MEIILSVMLQLKPSHYRPGHSRGGWGSWDLPEFLDNRHMKVARLSALRTGRLYPPGDNLILLSVRSLSRPQGHTTAGTFKSKKIPMTPSGIDNMTFRLVAQCVNQMRHRVPP